MGPDRAPTAYNPPEKPGRDDKVAESPIERRGNSRPVQGGQQGVHPGLRRQLSRHLASPYRRPFAAHSLEAFGQAQTMLDAHGGPIVLDAGCGVGDSTRDLATQLPDHLVLGLDRSADRLSRRRPPLPPNARLIRTDLTDFWRLARRAGWAPARQYLLYPNPYPKQGQLGRRFYGHPVFLDLLALGGRLECRSNWRTYIQEMELALKMLGFRGAISPVPEDSGISSAFEQKYRASGHDLWRLVAELGHERVSAPTSEIPDRDLNAPAHNGASH